MENILLAYIGIALLAGGSFAASAVAAAICGRTAIGAMKKKPDALGTYFILSALPLTQGLYGFVGFILLRSFLVAEVTLVQACAIFGVGLIMAAVGFIASIGQARICANGIEATASGHNVVAPTMIMAVLPELYAIFALLVTILTSFVI